MAASIFSLSRNFRGGPTDLFFLFLGPPVFQEVAVVSTQERKADSREDRHARPKTASPGVLSSANRRSARKIKDPRRRGHGASIVRPPRTRMWKNAEKFPDAKREANPVNRARSDPSGDAPRRGRTPSRGTVIDLRWRSIDIIAARTPGAKGERNRGTVIDLQ